MSGVHFTDHDSVLHVSCTVTKGESSSAHLRHNRSQGSLICVECGMRFSDLSSLQTHIQNKTVWTNRTLLGCRVSVMWAHNQWYEGKVTQFDLVHGRHCVVYDDGEQKWYHMANKTFYIVSLGDYVQDYRQETETEFKSNFSEPLSKNYLLAQSVVHQCFGSDTQQVGYRTDGHLCITEKDRVVAHDTGSSLLYGEVLPRGCNKILDREHLDAASASSLYDLGMGIGKFALQAFVQFQNLKKVVGVELAYSRFILGEKAVLTLLEERSDEYELVSRVPKQCIVIAAIDAEGNRRILEFRRSNLFTATDASEADIVIVQTNFPAEAQTKLCRFLACMKSGCRILTYLNLMPLWKRAPLMFRQLDINRSPDDRFATSWSMHRGCHFFLWERMDIAGFFEGQKEHGACDDDGAIGSSCFCAIFRCCNPHSRVENMSSQNQHSDTHSSTDTSQTHT